MHTYLTSHAFESCAVGGWPVACSALKMRLMEAAGAAARNMRSMLNRRVDARPSKTCAMRRDVRRVGGGEWGAMGVAPTARRDA